MGNVQYLAYLGCILLYLVISRYIRYISSYPAISGPDIVKYLVQRRVTHRFPRVPSYKELFSQNLNLGQDTIVLRDPESKISAQKDTGRL